MATDNPTTGSDRSATKGASVRIALVDSGVNAHHTHVQHVAGGIHFFLDDQKHLRTTLEYTDEIGHGTALAGLIRAKAPKTDLYAVKIFQDHLATSYPVLEAALNWSIQAGMKIVNLSLGLVNPAHKESLTRIVSEAKRKGIIIVAGSPPERTDVLPACLPGVVSVAAAPECGWNQHFMATENSVAFRAHPHPRSLPGPAQAQNFYGHSFAAGHITGTLAQRVLSDPSLTPDSAVKYLRQTSSPPKTCITS